MKQLTYNCVDFHPLCFQQRTRVPFFIAYLEKLKPPSPLSDQPSHQDLVELVAIHYTYQPPGPGDQTGHPKKWPEFEEVGGEDSCVRRRQKEGLKDVEK